MLKTTIKVYRDIKAFTLAEVLVTLAVIGMVAALSIPAIVHNAEEAGIASKVLKYDSILNQAFNQYAVDKGCVGNLECTGAFAGSDHEYLGNEIKPYFNVIKDCGIATGTGECFPAGVMYKRLDGGDWETIDNQGHYKILLSDGTALRLTDFSNQCTNDRSDGGTSALSEVCGLINADLNGHKGPNQNGRDIFTWWITKNGVYAAGALDDTIQGCNPTIDSGHACTAKVIKERAINY